MTFTNGHWNTLPPLPQARSHPAVAVYKQEIFVFGGGAENFRSLNDCYRYNPETEQWTPLADMPTKRSGTAAFEINGKIYVVGGGFKKPEGNFQFLKTVEIYDPENDSWVTGPDMNQPHDYPASCLHEGAIYILGGHHPEACLGGPRTDPGFDFCECWRPGETSWTQLAPLPTPRFAAAAVSRGNEILTCGGVAFRPEGFNNFDFFENYTVAENQWHQSSKLTLPWPAAGHGLCLNSDHLFFFGGYSTDDIHHRAAVYDEAANEWLRLPDMPVARAAMGVASIGSSIYLLGGWQDDGRTPMDSVVSYTFDS